MSFDTKMLGIRTINIPIEKMNNCIMKGSSPTCQLCNIKEIEPWKPKKKK